MALLSDSAITSFLGDHPNWELDGIEIVRTFEFADFSDAMGFVTRVALASEEAFHHPDIDIRWNKVRIALSTHSEGGLTEKDTSLAAVFDGFSDA